MTATHQTVRNTRPAVTGAGSDEQGARVIRLLLTPEEAARAIGLGRTKLYELLRMGAIESVQIGTARRVPVDALHEYVERLRTEAEEALA
jgi:excisionase family DNA binding protein